MLLVSGNYSFVKNYVEDQLSTEKKIVGGIFNTLFGTPGYGLLVRHQLKKCLEGITAREELQENKNMTVYEIETNGIKLNWHIPLEYYVIKDKEGNYTWKVS